MHGEERNMYKINDRIECANDEFVRTRWLHGTYEIDTMVSALNPSAGVYISCQIAGGLLNCATPTQSSNLLLESISLHTGRKRSDTIDSKHFCGEVPYDKFYYTAYMPLRSFVFKGKSILFWPGPAETKVLVNFRTFNKDSNQQEQLPDAQIFTIDSNYDTTILRVKTLDAHNSFNDARNILNDTGNPRPNYSIYAWDAGSTKNHGSQVKPLYAMSFKGSFSIDVFYRSVNKDVADIRWEAPKLYHGYGNSYDGDLVLYDTNSSFCIANRARFMDYGYRTVLPSTENEFGVPPEEFEVLLEQCLKVGDDTLNYFSSKFRCQLQNSEKTIFRYSDKLSVVIHKISEDKILVKYFDDASRPDQTITSCTIRTDYDPIDVLFHKSYDSVYGTNRDLLFSIISIKEGCTKDGLNYDHAMQKIVINSRSKLVEAVYSEPFSYKVADKNNIMFVTRKLASKNLKRGYTLTLKRELSGKHVLKTEIMDNHGFGCNLMGNMLNCAVLGDMELFIKSSDSITGKDNRAIINGPAFANNIGKKLVRKTTDKKLLPRTMLFDGVSYVFWHGEDLITKLSAFRYDSDNKIGGDIVASYTIELRGINYASLGINKITNGSEHSIYAWSTVSEVNSNLSVKQLYKINKFSKNDISFECKAIPREIIDVMWNNTAEDATLYATDGKFYTVDIKELLTSNYGLGYRFRLSKNQVSQLRYSVNSVQDRLSILGIDSKPLEVNSTADMPFSYFSDRGLVPVDLLDDGDDDFIIRRENYKCNHGSTCTTMIEICKNTRERLHADEGCVARILTHIPPHLKVANIGHNIETGSCADLQFASDCLLDIFYLQKIRVGSIDVKHKNCATGQSSLTEYRKSTVKKSVVLLGADCREGKDDIGYSRKYLYSQPVFSRQLDDVQNHHYGGLYTSNMGTDRMNASQNQLPCHCEHNIAAQQILGIIVFIVGFICGTLAPYLNRLRKKYGKMCYEQCRSKMQGSTRRKDSAVSSVGWHAEGYVEAPVEDVEQSTVQNGAESLVLPPKKPARTFVYDGSDSVESSSIVEKSSESLPLQKKPSSTIEFLCMTSTNIVGTHDAQTHM